MPLNAILLPPFLVKAVILDGQASLTDIPKIFTTNILEHRTKVLEDTPDIGEDYSSLIEDKTTENKKKDLKYVVCQDTEAIATYYNNILALIQAVKEK